MELGLTRAEAYSVEDAEMLQGPLRLRLPEFIGGHVDLMRLK